MRYRSRASLVLGVVLGGAIVFVVLWFLNAGRGTQPKDIPGEIVEAGRNVKEAVQDKRIEVKSPVVVKERTSTQPSVTVKGE